MRTRKLWREREGERERERERKRERERERERERISTLIFSHLIRANKTLNFGLFSSQTIKSRRMCLYIDSIHRLTNIYTSI